MRVPSLTRRLLPALLLAFPVLAHAHPGHEGHDLTWDFTGGALHPLFGVDHLLAIVTVGVWAAHFARGSRWVLPAWFVGALALGGAWSVVGVAVPLLEVLIAGSVLLLGLCLFRASLLPGTLAAPLVGLFGLFHGMAHGREIPATSVAWSYGVGLVAMTIVLHAAGLAIGAGVRQASARWRHALAVGVAGAGGLLLAR